jgi:hypothetical protein
VLHASLATFSIDVRWFRSGEGAAFTLTRETDAGALLPVSPGLGYSVEDFGMPVDESRLVLYRAGDLEPVFEEPWSGVRGRSGVASLDDGHTYTVVWVGPAPFVTDTGWWNPPGFTIVDNVAVPDADAGAP